MKNFQKKLLLIIVLLAFAASALLAQTTLRAFITVKDNKTDKPIVGAKLLMFETERPNSRWERDSDEKGVITITGFPPGLITFEITCEGYMNYRFTHRMRTTEATTEMTIRMEPIVRKEGVADDKIAARYSEGSKLMQEGKIKEALAIFEDLLTKYPDIKETYFSAAFAYKNLGDNQKAIEVLLKLNEMEPNNDSTLLMLSEIYMATGKKEEANKFLLMALDANPGDVFTLEKVAMMAYESGNYEDAIKYYTKALEIEPTNPLPYYYLGNIYYIGDDFANAVKNYEMYIKYDPENKTGGVEAAKEMLKDAKSRIEAQN